MGRKKFFEKIAIFQQACVWTNGITKEFGDY